MLKNVLIGCVLSVMIFPVHAVERFLAGEHYLIVGDTQAEKPSKPAVLEFFSFGCGHCEALEGPLTEWRAKQGDNIVFDRVPAQWSGYFRTLGQLYLALDKLGVADKHSAAVFHAIHKEKKQLRKAEQVIEFAEKTLGLNKQEFEAAWNSEQVKQRLAKAGVLLREYKVSGVPAILVNSRYYTSVSMAGGHQELFDVIEFLIQK